MKLLDILFNILVAPFLIISVLAGILFLAFVNTLGYLTDPLVQWCERRERRRDEHR